MAKLYFHYSTMNAGKSTLLLQASHNYREGGMATYLITAQFDRRAGEGRIASRIGIGEAADTFAPDEDLYEKLKSRFATGQVACVFIDEAQFLTREQVVTVGEAVIKIHRDWGDRTDRKHARIKYVLQEKGVEWFRGELAKHLCAALPAAKPFQFKGQGDAFGWSKQRDGNWFLGLFIETGRVKDAGDYRLKTALRVVAERFNPTFRLTATQNLILSHVKEADKAALEQVLRDHGCAIVFNPGLVKGRGMACPALPTCGLSLAESERVFPTILGKLEDAQAAAGFGGRYARRSSRETLFF